MQCNLDRYCGIERVLKLRSEQASRINLPEWWRRHDIILFMFLFIIQTLHYFILILILVYYTSTLELSTQVNFAKYVKLKESPCMTNIFRIHNLKVSLNIIPLFLSIYLPQY